MKPIISMNVTKASSAKGETFSAVDLILPNPIKTPRFELVILAQVWSAKKKLVHVKATLFVLLQQ